MIILANNAHKFGVTIKGKVINLLPPKLKHLRKIVEASKSLESDDGDDISVTSETASIILSRNEKDIEYTSEWVESNLDIVDLKTLFRDYTSWVKSIQNSPNSQSHIAKRR